jgi:tetratricopeptide (TPR) repeat protein
MKTKAISQNRILTLLPYLFICVIIFAVYFQTLSYGFVGLDDDIVTQSALNASNSQLNLNFLHQPFLEFYYRPLVNLSFILDGQFINSQPLIFHLSNIIYHCLFCCLLLYLLILLQIKRKISFLIALIYAIHPLFVNAVVWIVGRCDVLMSLFLILSFIFFVHYIIKGRWWYLCLHLVAFALAVFSKETAIAAPFIFILYAIIAKKRILSKIYLFSGWFLIILAYIYLRSQAFSRIFNISNLSFATFISSLGAIPELIGKLLVPLRLSGLPMYNPLTITIGLVGIIGLIWLTYSKRRSKEFPFMIFGILWFLIFLLPGMFMRIEESDVKYLECRAYLPMIGISIIVAYVINKWQSAFRVYSNIIIFAIIIIFIGINLSYSKSYKDQFSFYNNIINISPNNALALNNRSAYRYKKGDLQGAIDDCVKALKVKPDYAVAYNNMGLFSEQLGNNSQALTYYNKTIGLDPKYVDAYYNRGILRSKMGNYAGAADDYSRAIELKPNDSETYNNRGNARRQIGDKAGAIADYDNAIRINPNNPQAYYNRGNYKLDCADYRGAIDDYNKAASITPNFQYIYSNRANAEVQIGEYSSAMNDYTKAISLKPDFADAYYNRGLLYKKINDFENAIADFDKAIQLKPDFAKAYFLRSVAKEKLGNFKGAEIDREKAKALGL